MSKKLPLINREISWLSFNERVLQEAADKTLPLLERLKFLGIYSNNLDEFFRVRVATLTRMTHVQTKNKPELILEKINAALDSMQNKFSEIYQGLLLELQNENIFIVDETQLCEEHGLFVKKYFNEKVRTNLFPLMLNTPLELGLLKDKSVYLAIGMEKYGKIKMKDYALVKVPASVLGRFVVLPDIDEKKYIIILDDVIRYCLNELFSIFDYDKFNAYTIKFSRDAEMDVDNDIDKSLMQKIHDSLKQRKRGKPVRFVYDREMPEGMLEAILKKLKVNKKNSIVAGDRYHNFKDFMAFPNLGMPHLEFSSIEPLIHPDFLNENSILNVIKKKDVMLHFPYHSFKHIIDLLREASIDPKVKVIKMTIYRVAKNSNVINALINAARNGKKVTVFLELQARFDEEANIYWSKVLMEEGVSVLHGKKGLKVHSKLIFIKRKEGENTVSYANIGTGNFNEQTSKIYSDNSLLTSRKIITDEVEKVFSLFEIDYKPLSFNKLMVSPFNFRSGILKLIDKEILNAKKNIKAQIILKLNSFVDEQFVAKIYEAAQSGVDVKIIARGICVLIPGVKNISENIEAISIVGRFLEHSRIYYFYNGGAEKYFISSADLMTRNIDHRIEVTCPVLDKNIQKELSDILNIQLKDNMKARMLDEKRYNQHKKTDTNNPIESQSETYRYLKSISKT